MIPASFEYSVTNWPVSAGTKASRRAGGRQKERKEGRKGERKKERKKLTASAKRYSLQTRI